MLCLLQSNSKLLLQSHSDTLLAMRRFWRELLGSGASFATLSRVRHDVNCNHEAFFVPLLMYLFTAS